MANLTIQDRDLLQAALEGLQLQRARIEAQISTVQARLGVRRGRPPKGESAPVAVEAGAKKRRRRRKLSAEALANIRAGQQKRWAKARREQAKG